MPTKKATPRSGWVESSATPLCDVCGAPPDLRGPRMYRDIGGVTTCEPCQTAANEKAERDFHKWYPTNRRKAVDQAFAKVVKSLRDAADRLGQDVDRNLAREDADEQLEQSADAMLNELAWIFPNLSAHTVHR